MPYIKILTVICSLDMHNKTSGRERFLNVTF